MKEIKDRIFDRIMILIFVYPVAVFLAVLFILFRFFGRIRIVHPERFPHGQGNLIVLPNHPSLVEPILLPVMLYRGYLLHPFKLIPWSTPDKKNYFNRWYWHWLLKYAAIPIDRDDQQERSKAFRRLAKILRSGGITVIFGEGGRTQGGSSSPTSENSFFYSPKNKKKIRPLQEGVASLIRKSGALVVPIWVERTKKASLNLPDRVYFASLILIFFLELWKKEAIIIKIGRPLKFQKSDSREKITQELVTKLLDLADED